MHIPTHADQLSATSAVMKSAGLTCSPALFSLLVMMSTEQLAAVALWIGDAYQNGKDDLDPRYNFEDQLG